MNTSIEFVPPTTHEPASKNLVREIVNAHPPLKIFFFSIDFLQLISFPAKNADLRSRISRIAVRASQDFGSYMCPLEICVHWSGKPASGAGPRSPVKPGLSHGLIAAFENYRATISTSLGAKILPMRRICAPTPRSFSSMRS